MTNGQTDNNTECKLRKGKNYNKITLHTIWNTQKMAECLSLAGVAKPY